MIVTPGHLLGFRLLYEDQGAKDKTHYANLIGREFLFQVACYFLTYFRFVNIMPSLDELLKEWFTFNEVGYDSNPDYPDVYNRIIAFREKNLSANLKLLNVESFLRLFEWLLEQPSNPDESVVQGPEQCLPLFQLYLLFNDEVLKGLDTARRSISDRQDDRYFVRLAVAQSFPQQDFLNNNYSQLLLTQFYKAAKLLEYLSGDARYVTILSRYMIDMHCDDVRDYFRKLGSAVITPFSNNQRGWTVFNVPPGASFEESCEFLESVAVNVDEDAADDENDYLLLRSKPLQRLQRGSYRVIYDSFLIKKVYNGLLFHLFSMVRKSPSLFQANLMSTLRDEFSEGTLLYHTLAAMYPDERVVKIPGKAIKGKIDGEPDFYLREGNMIVLFESKDFYIKGSIKSSYDFTKIESELLLDGRLGKAIGQLVKNMARIWKRAMPMDNEYKLEEIIVCPVIIVHDALYSAPGLNYYANYWLQDALVKLHAQEGHKVSGQLRVLPLTIVEIDSLILYQDHFRMKDIDFISLLKEFHIHVQYGMNFPQHPIMAEMYLQQSIVPFAHFLSTYAKEAGIVLRTTHIDDVLFQAGMNR